MIGECLAAGFPENGRQLVDVLAANAVENARLALVPLEHLLHLADEIQARENAIIEIRPVEIADENGRVLEPELLADIAPDLLGGGGGVSMERDVRELLAQAFQLAIFRPKIVAPMADAMGLVDGNRLDIESSQEDAKVGNCQSFRRHE